jgi:N-formylglutamate amidohydrolase
MIFGLPLGHVGKPLIDSLSKDAAFLARCKREGDHFILHEIYKGYSKHQQQ